MAWQGKLIGMGLKAWWFVRRPRTFGARAVLLDAAGRIALVRHSYLDGWYLPGGGVDRGESASAAAARELKEEIGIEGAAIERVLGVYHSQRQYKDDHVVVFVMRVGAGGESALRPTDAREIAAAEWFAIGALPEGTSPATRRRVREYLDGVTGSGTW